MSSKSLLLFLSVIAVASTAVHRRSECDGQPDGEYCFGGASGSLVYCRNGDVSWRSSCIQDCIITGPASAFCQTTQYCTTKGPGSLYREAKKKTSCYINGAEVNETCATNGECRQVGNEFAYCYAPPQCKKLTATEQGLFGDGKICSAPSWDVATDINITASLQEAVELSGLLTVRNPDCAFLAKEASCAIAFPDCPTPRECHQICTLYNGCGDFYTNNTFVAEDCTELCGGDASSLFVNLFLIIGLTVLSLMITL
eukprot:TRINITY_DN259_c0_g1_i1.p1 TRINITY_DN259_c0_g1~~TRINITY_DN259_c0_g1_i1.p1  ORF type:complete len:256 (+),score=26.79 TRINITY_DN259_c0_g1_i1:16-783(+)